jgi:hypothetical protein
MRACSILMAPLLACVASGTRPPAPPTPSVSAPAPACVDPAFRGFDFWIGDWTLVVKARAAPDSPTWTEAKGTQHVEAILGGCAIAEHFAADGPGPAWAGTSLSVWQPALGAWRQTWVDDQGSYLAFTGGVQDGAMTLVGEAQTQGTATAQKRMRFERVTADALHWVWQLSRDGGRTWQDQLVIEYRRATADARR